MNNNIVLGVTGGIAAYKAADLCSRLTQAGCCVHVIMTENACNLVTPLTFMTLSRNPVTVDCFNAPGWRPEHVALAESADLAIIAPATCNIIGKWANGIADDALSTFLITFRKPVLAAPAMNPAMYESPAFVRNLALLREWGVIVVEPDFGHVACGAPGKGRMASVETIFKRAEEL